MPGKSDKYEFVKGLGHGGFGIVELWRQLDGGEDLVVAKRIFVEDMTKMELEEVKQEAQILKMAEHPHIVRYVGSWVKKETNDLIILQGYYPGGDMGELIKTHKSKKQLFPSGQVLRWLAQLAHALQYCHRVCRLVHRDLKPSNLFLVEDHSSIHLGDFGISRSLGSTASLCQTFIGTQAYMSPEVTRMQSYGPKSDVWSFGAIIYELCTLRRLYPSLDMVALLHTISSDCGPPSLPADSEYPNELRHLCSAVLVKDPEDRPSFDQLLQDHDLLRVSVLQLERDTEWSDSLVPARDETAEFEPVHAKDSEKIIRIFQKFDSNGDGFIDKDELTQVLHELNPEWSDGMARLLLETIDVNGDGWIDYKEFVQWLMGSRDEWDEVRHSMLHGSTAEVEAESEPCVVTSDGKPHTIEKVSFLSQAGMNNLLDAAAKAKERLLAGSSLENMSSSATAGIDAAVDVKDLVELTVRRQEFEGLLERLPIEEPDLDLLGSEGARESAADVASWSVRELKDFISARGGSLLGISEKSELIALCRELQSKEGCPESAELDEATQRKAAVISTRLRCIKVMQSEEPDPVDLTITLRQAKSLNMVADPCVKALVGHSCRLGMSAEDIVNSDKAHLRELEDAAAIIEAAQHVIDLVDAGVPICFDAKKVLEIANERLHEERQEKKQVGIRCQCGPFFKNISVPPDMPWPDIKEELAQRWDRPVAAFTFSWRNGPDTHALDSEEDWERCSRTQCKARSIEVKATLDRSKLSPSRRGQKGKPASKKQRPRAEKTPAEKPRADRKPPVETAPREKKTVEEKPTSPLSPERPPKRTLAGLAASSALRTPSRAGGR